MSDESFFAPEYLLTDRFLIRRYRVGDGALLAEATNNSYEHLSRFMPWAVPHQSDEEAERTARRFAAQYITSQDFPLAIFLPDGSRLLGSTGFHIGGLHSLKRRSAEIGMWIRADAAGQSLGTAALRALIAWGFTAWPWERLFWRCAAANEASAAVARNGGMEAEGRLRGMEREPDGSRTDQLLFSILKQEWQPPRPSRS